jgi:hypothetical protein
MEAVWIALVLAAQVLALAIVQAVISARKEKRDYARQDLVADRVEDAAKAVTEVARVAAVADARVQARLTEIHILVNSDMTAARTAERDAMKLLVLALKQVRASNVKLGVQPVQELTEEIDRAEARIVELDQILADRHAAQLRVEQEAATHPQRRLDDPVPAPNRGTNRS